MIWTKKSPARIALTGTLCLNAVFLCDNCLELLTCQSAFRDADPV